MLYNLLYRIKNKLNEKRGTALTLALLILALLTIMAACFSLVVPAAYQVDETTRKLEQGTIYAKAGLNIAVDEILSRASAASEGQTTFIRNLGNSGKTIKGSFSDLVYKDSGGSTITADEAKCPELDSFNDLDLTISFDILNSGAGTSSEVFKVISTVNYEGIEASAFRYLYFSTSAAGTETNPFNEDALACSEYVNVLTSIDGRIRAREVHISGNGTYRSVYAIETLATGYGVTIQRDDTGIEGTEGDLYSLNSLSFSSLVMKRAGDTSSYLEEVGGTIAAGGYILTEGYGGISHPEAIIAHGNEKTEYTSSDLGTTKNYAICMPAAAMYYIGDPDIYNTTGKCTSESDIPVAIYSNGNCLLGFNSDVIIYGNVFINGDLDLTTYSQVTIYGNLYITGSINKLTWASDVVVNPLPYTDSSGGTLGGNVETGLTSDEFSSLTASSTWLSYQDIKDAVGDRNLKNAILPTTATSNRIKIQDFIGSETDGVYSVNYDGVSAYANGEQTYGVLRVTESCEITGDMKSLIGSDSDGNYSAASAITDSSGNNLPIAWGEMVLFLDASKLSDGENLDVVISGDWIFGGGNTGLASRRIYVCDKDGKCNVRLFLKGGDNGNAAHLYVTNGQVYVPASSADSVTATNIFSKTVPGVDMNLTGTNHFVPRFFIFGQGQVDSSESIVTDDDVMTSVDISGSGTFDGFILTPISSVNISGTTADRLHGKVSAGIFTSTTPSGQVLTYVRPTNQDIYTDTYPPLENYEDSATLGVFETDSGAFET